MKKMLYDRRGQIGETLTWTIAIILILVLLVIAVALATGISGSGQKYFPQPDQIDLFAKESLTSYLITKDGSGVSVYNEIRQNGLNDFSGNLASRVFNGLYGTYYNRAVYLGVLNSEREITGSSNKYFTSPAAAIVSRAGESSPTVAYEINLTNGKFIQLLLWHS